MMPHYSCSSDDRHTGLFLHVQSLFTFVELGFDVSQIPKDVFQISLSRATLVLSYGQPKTYPNPNQGKNRQHVTSTAKLWEWRRKAGKKMGCMSPVSPVHTLYMPSACTVQSSSLIHPPKIRGRRYIYSFLLVPYILPDPSESLE